MVSVKQRIGARGGRAAFILLFLVSGLFVLPAILISCQRERMPPSLSAVATNTVPPAGTFPLPVETPNPIPSAYPLATATPLSSGYPGDPAVTLPPTGYPGQEINFSGTPSFFPIIVGPAQSSPTPTATLSPTSSQTPTPTPTPTPTIDFAAVRAQLQAGGQDLAFVKIGFHTGIGGNRTGLGAWMRTLDTAGVPFFLKSADDAGPIYEAQQIARASGVPHVLVYRRSGDEYDTPNYRLPPAQAAAEHWQRHRAVFPPELDPSMVWLETINEVDKNRSEWLAQFALETARLALADGFRWAAFGWSAGEPEPHDWQSPAMLEFLRLAAAHPDRLAIALHEYSYLASEIGHDYPHKVGRFQQLYEICDRHGIARPTILITEWGWTYQRIPPIDQALADIEWAATLYAPYPELKGAAIWYLGGGFGEIATEAQRLITPLTHYNLGNYFVVPLPPHQATIDPERYRP